MKISIIGAGRVGSHIALFCAMKQLGEVHLYDIDSCLAEGHAMDINQMLASRHSTGDVVGDDIAGFGKSDIVVIAVGKRRVSGQKRIDLLDTNKHYVVAASILIQKYSPNAIVIVVTNPLDEMTEMAYKSTGFAKERVIGMGSSLDTARYIEIIHERTKKPRYELDFHVTGTHNEEMIHHGETVDPLDIEKSKSLAIDTIEKKGCTEFAPAMCVANIIEAIVSNSGAKIPVSSYHEEDKKCYGKIESIGKYGIKKMD